MLVDAQMAALVCIVVGLIRKATMFFSCNISRAEIIRDFEELIFILSVVI